MSGRVKRVNKYYIPGYKTYSCLVVKQTLRTVEPQRIVLIVLRNEFIRYIKKRSSVFEVLNSATVCIQNTVSVS